MHKTIAVSAVDVNFRLSIFKFKSDLIDEYIQWKFQYFVKGKEYYVPIPVFGHLWLVSILSYSKRCIPFNGIYIEYCESSNKNIYLAEKFCTLWRQFHYITQLYSQIAFVQSINRPCDKRSTNAREPVQTRNHFFPSARCK